MIVNNGPLRRWRSASGCERRPTDPWGLDRSRTHSLAVTVVEAVVAALDSE